MGTDFQNESFTPFVGLINERMKEEEQTISNKSIGGDYLQPGTYTPPQKQFERVITAFHRRFPMQLCSWSPATYIVDSTGNIFYLMDIISGNYGYDLQFQVAQFHEMSIEFAESKTDIPSGSTRLDNIKNNNNINNGNIIDHEDKDAFYASASNSYAAAQN